MPASVFGFVGPVEWLGDGAVLHHGGEPVAEAPSFGDGETLEQIADGLDVFGGIDRFPEFSHIGHGSNLF